MVDRITRLLARTATSAAETEEAYWLVQKAAQAAGATTTRSLSRAGWKSQKRGGKRLAEQDRAALRSLASAVTHALKKARGAAASVS